MEGDLSLGLPMATTAVASSHSGALSVGDDVFFGEGTPERIPESMQSQAADEARSCDEASDLWHLTRAFTGWQLLAAIAAGGAVGDVAPEEREEAAEADADALSAMMGGMGEGQAHREMLVEERAAGFAVAEDEDAGEVDFDAPFAMRGGLGEEQVYRVTLAEESTAGAAVPEEEEAAERAKGKGKGSGDDRTVGSGLGDDGTDDESWGCGGDDAVDPSMSTQRAAWARAMGWPLWELVGRHDPEDLVAAGYPRMMWRSPSPERRRSPPGVGLVLFCVRRGMRVRYPGADATLSRETGVRGSLLDDGLVDAAFTAFIVLLARDLLVSDPDLVMHLSRVDECMKRARVIDAVKNCRFWFR